MNRRVVVTNPRPYGGSPNKLLVGKTGIVVESYGSKGYGIVLDGELDELWFWLDEIEFLD